MMLDVVEQINAVQRTVGTRTLDAGAARSVIITLSYAAPIDDLWDACTNAERIGRWFLPVTGDLRVGGRYQLEGNAGGVVERCDPPNGFDATWEFDPGGGVTWIELRLTALPDGGTRLKLEHIAHVDERWTEFGPGAVGVGWDMGLLGLAEHLRSGLAVDREQSATWLGSPEGKQFITLSSERWQAASVAAGTPAADARGAAERTTAAYTSAPV